MDKDGILNQVQLIFREVLELPQLNIDYNTNAYLIPEWDSIAHIQLVIEVETVFHIKFTAKEIAEFKNVGEMCEVIFLKIN